MLRQTLAQKTLESLGWTFNNRLPDDVPQCVMIAAPHTSNWDSLYTKLAFIVMDIPVKITIKDSYMKPPFGVFVRAMGGIGIAVLRQHRACKQHCARQQSRHHPRPEPGLFACCVHCAAPLRFCDGGQPNIAKLRFKPSRAGNPAGSRWRSWRMFRPRWRCASPASVPDRS